MTIAEAESAPLSAEFHFAVAGICLALMITGAMLFVWRISTGDDGLSVLVLGSVLSSGVGAGLGLCKGIKRLLP